jgi:hypothetical protein
MRRYTLIGAALLGLILLSTARLLMSLHRGDARAAWVGHTIPNIRVSHDAYPAHAEPSVAVNPRNPRNLLGSAMFVAGHTVRIGTFVSFDGGRIWRDNGLLPVPPGMEGADTTVAFDAHGFGFVAAILGMASDNGNHVSSRTGVYVWRTDNGGHSFSHPVPVVRGQPIDHPWMASEPGTNTLFLAWRTKQPDGLAVSRSTDGGRTFRSRRIIFTSESPVAWAPMVAAGPRSRVYVAFEMQGGEPKARAEVLSSSDHGRTFGQPTVLGPASMILSPSSQVHLPDLVSVAADPRTDAVYVAYSAYRGNGAHVPILLARSTDGGKSWSQPIAVTSQPDSHTVYVQPRVVVDGAHGVDVSYFALSGKGVTVMLARSTTAEISFDPPQRISSRAFDPARGVRENGKAGSWWIGDYQGLAVGGGMIFPFWNDTRTSRLEIFTAAVPMADAH